VQLGLYAVVQELLVDRLVWFLRNVDLDEGLAKIVEHYREGIAGVAAALEDALPDEAAEAHAERIVELVGAGVPESLTQRIADLALLAAAPDILLVADRTKKPVADVTATYFAAESFFRLDRIIASAAEIQTTDYFDRLALNRALDSIGDAARRITAAMVATGSSGNAAVEAWVEPHASEVRRIRTAVHEIAASGLTISKLSVAASLLSDLAKG
jgi:glutamate dehydrogenase